MFCHLLLAFIAAIEGCILKMKHVRIHIAVKQHLSGLDFLVTCTTGIGACKINIMEDWGRHKRIELLCFIPHSVRVTWPIARVFCILIGLPWLAFLTVTIGFRTQFVG